MGVDGFDARCICDAEEISVANGEDDEVPSVFCGELSAFEVMPGGDIVFERGDVYQILSEIGPEIDDLEWADDWIQARKLETEGREVNLLNLDACGCADGGKKRLQLFKTLAVCVLFGRTLQNDSEVLTETALDGIVQREIEYAAGRFVCDDASVERVLGGLRTVLSGGVVELLLRVGDWGAFGGGIRSGDWSLLGGAC